MVPSTEVKVETVPPCRKVLDGKLYIAFTGIQFICGNIFLKPDYFIARYIRDLLNHLFKTNVQF